MQMVSRQAWLWLVNGSLLLIGCGAGPARPQPVSAPRAPLTELDALQRDLDVSESELTQQLQRSRPEPPRASQKRERAEPRDAEAKAPAAEAARDEAEQSVGGNCDLSCRALSSMRRAADGICNLTREQHPRCADARSRVQASARQVAATGCLCRP